MAVSVCGVMALSATAINWRLTYVAAWRVCAWRQWPYGDICGYCDAILGCSWRISAYITTPNGWLAAAENLFSAIWRNRLMWHGGRAIWLA